MRLVCLECSAAYEAPDSLFGPQPREVRCNRCGYQWTVVGSRPEDNGTSAGLSIGPAEAQALAPSPPPDLPRPRPAIAPSVRPEPLPVAPQLPPAPPVPGSARLADTLAGPLTPNELPIAAEAPRPVLVAEPAAESTRALLSSGPEDTTDLMPPDPEERRLSHELDFGETERQRRTSNGGSGGGTRRAVIILILLLILAGIGAVVFKTQIIAAVPGLKPTYAQLGL